MFVVIILLTFISSASAADIKKNGTNVVNVQIAIDLDKMKAWVPDTNLLAILDGSNKVELSSYQLEKLPKIMDEAVHNHCMKMGVKITKNINAVFFGKTLRKYIIYRFSC